jgi:uncharacterized cupredoxin-like copper-binding protein
MGSLKVLLVLALAGLSLAACSDGGDGGPKVELSEFSITVDPSSVESGEVSFAVENVGAIIHEFVVVSTDLDSSDLATTADGSVDEAGEGITPIDEIEDIEAGDSGSLTVSLDPGNYVLFCNVVDGDQVHYQAGMHTTFTVTE